MSKNQSSKQNSSFGVGSVVGGYLQGSIAGITGLLSDINFSAAASYAQKVGDEIAVSAAEKLSLGFGFIG